MKKHGHTSRAGKSTEYNSWQAMKRRCYDKNHDSYKHYGGREITVCGRWRNSFENFLVDMGFKPTTKHTLERKDSLGNYTPDNCKWATWTEQLNNTRRNRVVELKGEKKTVAQWCRVLGLNYEKIMGRLKTGWAPEKAFEVGE